MKKHLLALLILSVLTGTTSLYAGRIPVIFDTDLGNDVDDAIALSMLYSYADEGKVDILAIGLSKGGRYPAECLDIFNHWHCHQDIPIGSISGGVICGNEESDYAKAIAQQMELAGRYAFPRNLSIDHSSLPEAVEVYRKALVKAEDASVVMVVTGFATNMSRLLSSGPDGYSDLCGRDLILKKVKSLVVMAGSFDGTKEREYNVRMDVESYKTLTDQWPTDIIFAPYELGLKVLYPVASIETGFCDGHPLTECYRNFKAMPYDRPCWDPVTLLYAVEGAGLFKESRRGTVTISDNGASKFTPDPSGRHKYLSMSGRHARMATRRIVSLCERPERESDMLHGKTLVTCGDSFTEGDFWDYVDMNGNNDRRSPEIFDREWNCYMTYPYWIARRNGMKLINMARCGAMLGYPPDDSRCEVFVKEKMFQIPEDADYILFKFGINDSWHTTVGTPDDTDPRTFYGAWNTVLSYVKEHHPSAKIGVIASNDCREKEWAQAIVEICRRYDVPCLDEEGEDVPYFFGQNYKPYPQEKKDRMNEAYHCGPKNGHPNVDAHKIESHIVEKFLRSL